MRESFLRFHLGQLLRRIASLAMKAAMKIDRSPGPTEAMDDAWALSYLAGMRMTKWHPPVWLPSVGPTAWEARTQLLNELALALAKAALPGESMR